MRLLAAFTFFTRLPLWKIKEIPADDFKRIVPLWPLTGWLTGGVMALVFWLMVHVTTPILAWIVALASRLILTGALHEDGLADFIDGFGGGRSRERTLAIMKDSHIGTYGTIGLILYYLMVVQAADNIAPLYLCLMAFCGDAWSKCCAAQTINLLPYARSEEAAKNKTVYSRMTIAEWLMCLICGIVPTVLSVSLLGLPCNYAAALIAPVVVMLLMAWACRRRLGGYTGDCCGATSILCELSFYMTAVIAFPMVG